MPASPDLDADATIGSPELPFAAAEARLHDMARAMTGLDDFGPDEYLEGLRHWLRSLDEDADLSAAGRLMTTSLTLTALVGRLHSEQHFAAHPEVRRLGIERPIVILGLPRSGSTALHKMLCCDPRLQGLELWLAQRPMPRPPRASWRRHAAFAHCYQQLATTRRAAPELAELHPLAADEADECWNLLRQSFAAANFECSAGVHGYARWWARCDMRPAYARWADQLRVVGSNDPGRRWVLKDPGHLFAPDALLQALPDALFVMFHRDPAQSIPALCELTGGARRRNDRVFDPHALGREQLDLWARGLSRAMELRQREPGRVVDVHHADWRRDPLRVVRHVEERAGLAHDPDAEREMRAWHEAHPDRHLSSDPEPFGLSAAAIRSHLSNYVEEAGVVLED